MKKRWKRSVLAVVFLLAMAVLCIPAEKAEAKAPKLSRTKLSMTVGQKKTLKVKNTKKKVKWKSSDAKVIKVSKKGVLTARKAGKATIKAVVGKKTLKCKVTVKKRGDMTGQPSGQYQVQGGIYYIQTDGKRKGVEYPSGVLISSKKALQNYYKENRQYFAMAGSFKKAIDSFDKAYFKTKQLVVLRMETESGYSRYRVIGMDYKNGKYQVKLELMKLESGMCDMAQWHILIPVPEKIPVDTKIDILAALPGVNQYEATIVDAKLDSGESAISHTEYEGIQTLTNDITPQPVSCDGTQDFSEMRAFCYGLFGQTLAVSEKNPVISPVSAYFALSMAAAGSGGETQAQFAKVLGMTPELLEKNVLCSQLKGHLQNTKGSTDLSIANSMWLNQDYQVSRDYLQGIVDYFDSEVYSGKIDSLEMLNGINQWGNEKTRGMIPKILDDSLSGDTAWQLMNAAYLKAAWSQPFTKEDTREMVFYGQDGTELRTKFLYGERYLDHVETADAEGAVLPYDDGKTVFLALRPTDGTDVREFARRLDADKVKNYICNARREKFHFYMPKADIESDTNMKQMLKNMGLTAAFDERLADFYKIAAVDQERAVYIDKVFQKARIKIDEKGTEAAAITVVQAVKESVSIKPDVIRTLKLDSPYVYLVVDLPSQTPLFMGVMENPL